ncbi:MAG TPA: FAD-dependent oxidoreductase [Candidatus Merdenecus merdavium]|nr:FAD-dependent oxidoreductase [Candidatus Merdenecus merdavium]
MNKIYDAIVIGGGSAGLSAAIYLGRAQYKVLVIEKEVIGGQITITSDVVNYPGIIQTSGKELADHMKEQALHFGAEFLIGEVKDVDLKDEIKVVKTDKGEYEALSVVIATGASPRKIGFDGELEYAGRGVAYCATCDGEFFTGQHVFVIGGGFAAAEESMFLTKYAKSVTVVVREKNFTCAESIAKEVLEHDKINVVFETELLEVTGEDNIQKAVFRDNKKNETYEYDADSEDGFGVFVFAGYEPASKLFKDKIELDERGYIITDINQKTNIDGVYGAGDICVKDLRQVVTAVSDGATAATSIEKYLSPIHKKLGIKRESTKAAPVISGKGNTDHEDTTTQDGFIDSGMKAQLQPIFDKFEKTVVLKGYIDDSPISKEVKGFLDEVKELTDKVRVELIHKSEKEEASIEYPSIAFYNEEDEYLGVQLHGVPGGHEFNSFIVAMYNAAGPGQPIDEGILKRIKEIDKKTNIKVVISLSCTMCPDVVMGSSRIALENDQVEMEMYDMAHFPEIREKYQIKSVPCMIINDEEVHFGKKKIDDIVELLA